MSCLHQTSFFMVVCLPPEIVRKKNFFFAFDPFLKKSSLNYCICWVEIHFFFCLSNTFYVIFTNIQPNKKKICDGWAERNTYHFMFFSCFRKIACVCITDNLTHFSIFLLMITQSDAAADKFMHPWTLWWESAWTCVRVPCCSIIFCLCSPNNIKKIIIQSIYYN